MLNRNHWIISGVKKLYLHQQNVFGKPDISVQMPIIVDSSLAYFFIYLYNIYISGIGVLCCTVLVYVFFKINTMCAHQTKGQGGSQKLLFLFTPL